MTSIPPEALEAGARALARYNCAEFDKNPDRWTRYFRDEARAAITAALDAWPGMSRGKVMKEPEIIILPLPQEITLNVQDISALDVKSTREEISDE